MGKDLEEKLEELKINEEIWEKKGNIERQKALVKEMRAKYGPGWKRIIGWKNRDGTGLLESLSKMRINIR